MRGGLLHLAHGWTLVGGPMVSAALVADFIRPAVRAMPSSMASRLGFCRISILLADPEVSSRWTESGEALEVSLVRGDSPNHDLAMELLLCLGQALWERLSDEQLRAYWCLLAEEIRDGVTGEIDEQALDQKRSLLASRLHARSSRQLARYGRASFAGTAAEYVHCLWHDVTARSGPGYLPAAQLRRRLETFAAWFPPDRGYRLFSA